MKIRQRRSRPSEEVTDPSAALKGIFGQIGGSEFLAIFELLDICAEEVERYSNVGSVLWNALAPSEPFKRKHVNLYRAHVRELLARAEADERLDTLTESEMLLGFVEASLRAPLNRTGLAIYHHLFRRCIGERIYRETFEDIAPPPEKWEGQLEEDVVFMKRRVSPHPRPRKAEHRPRRK